MIGVGVAGLDVPSRRARGARRANAEAHRTAGSERGKKRPGVLKKAVLEVLKEKAGTPLRVYEVGEALTERGANPGKVNLSTILKRLHDSGSYPIKITKDGRNALYSYAAGGTG